MSALTKTFSTPGTFAARHAAERFLESAGFSVGISQGPSPRGILFGEYAIMKWRNLNEHERNALHGQMIGDGRGGPVTVEIFERAPVEAKRRFQDAVDADELPPCKNEGLAIVGANNECLRCGAEQGEVCR